LTKYTAATSAITLFFKRKIIMQGISKQLSMKVTVPKPPEEAKLPDNILQTLSAALSDAGEAKDGRSSMLDNMRALAEHSMKPPKGNADAAAAAQAALAASRAELGGAVKS
jgi:hypothetical protein